MHELEDAMMDVVRMFRFEAASSLSSLEGSRALLQARMRRLAAANPPPNSFPGWSFKFWAVAPLVTAAIMLTILRTGSSEAYAIPRADLTPGAVRPASTPELCKARLKENVDVVPAIQRQVFAEYGMPNAESRAYEVDYLITPALGGADDIRNRWPQPYSGSPWNAYVKDALEDRLWQMLCSGQIDLQTAQQDIAGNWIAAYRKYFQTRRPLLAHQRPRRDDESE